jgi:ApeA N-terminal domain 1
LSIRNKIRTRIAFTEPIRFAESIDRILDVRDLFGLLVGRPQNLSEILVARSGENGEGEPLEVHWSRSPKRPSADGAERPHCADVLIDLVRNPIVGGRVMQSWIAREEKWRTPRSRFFSAFENHNYYTAERLVAAANMFDVLPIDAIPFDAALSPELAEAKADAEQSFRRLEQSQERDSVVSVLGRIGRASLKQKVRHRAQLVANSLPQKLPEITTILDTAVDCRNHLVHGSPMKLPSQTLDSIMYLLTDTLEFIFGASDLVES